MSARVSEQVCIDTGNDFYKIVHRERIITDTSCYAEVLSPSEVLGNKAYRDENDPVKVTQYTGGDRKDLVGKFFSTGQTAAISAPKNHTRVGSFANNMGKPALGLQFLLDQLVPDESNQEIVIPCLYATLPEVELLATDMQRAFVGHHKVTHHKKTGAYSFSVVIEDVQLYEEGHPAMFYAAAQNVVELKVPNASIDWGGRTTIVCGYRENAIIIPSTRKVITKGVDDLAEDIAQDPRMKKVDNSEGNVGVILEAIRNHQPGELIFYGETGFEMTEIFNERFNIWLSSISAEIVTQLTEINPRLRRIVMFGGGVHLVRFLANGKKVICPDPETATLRGLKIISQRFVNKRKKGKAA